MITRLGKWTILLLASLFIAWLAPGVTAQSGDEAVDDRCLSEYVPQESSISTAAKINTENKALQSNPDDIDALMRRAFVYRAIGNFDDALADYFHILEVDPNYTDEFACNAALTFMLIAQSHLDYKEYDLAMVAIELALEVDPTFPTYAPIYVDRGLVYLYQGEFELALADFNDAIETLNDARAYASRAILYQFQGKLDESLDDLNTTLALDETYYYAYYTRSQVLDALGDRDAALRDLDALIENMPFSNAYVNRGALLTLMGDFDAAMSDFDAAMERDPNNFFLYVNRGYLYILLGQYEEAIADESRAIELDSTYTAPYQYRGIAYASLEDFEAAIADADRIIELIPDAPLAYRHRALLYVEMEDYDAAISDMNQMIELDPTNALYYTYRGAVYVEQGDEEAALADYDRAIELERSADMYRARGTAYDLLGDHEAAIDDFTRAIEMDGEAFGGYLYRGSSHAAAGEVEAAAADYMAWITGIEIESSEEAAIEIGDTVTVEMAVGRVFRIPFEGRAGQTIRVTADAASGTLNDALVVVLDADETPLVSDDDSGDGADVLIESYRLPARGTYWLVVSHAGGGREGEVVVTLSLAD